MNQKLLGFNVLFFCPLSLLPELSFYACGALIGLTYEQYRSSIVRQNEH